jgi:hypothetical protein
MKMNGIKIVNGTRCKMAAAADKSERRPNIASPTPVFFQLLLLCIVVIVFAACSNNNGRFRMEGSFKNLNQGEFYIYSPEDGSKDTIVVNDGHFTYERQMTDTLTLVMLFPNYSEIPIFARPNTEVKMEGDATHLKETQVTGTPENDAMTAFRTSTNEKMPPEVVKEAEKFIKENPTSSVSVHLLQKHFIQTATPDYAKALEMCRTLRKSQQNNTYLARLLTQLEELKNYRTEGQLPSFKVKATDGTSVTEASLKSKVNVIVAWATWNSASQAMLTTLKNLTRENPGKLSVVSIAMHLDKSEGKSVLERDSITWPDICDGEMWQSPVVAALGIGTVPTNIVTDASGKIVGRNLNNNDLKKKVQSLIETP